MAAVMIKSWITTENPYIALIGEQWGIFVSILEMNDCVIKEFHLHIIAEL